MSNRSKPPYLFKIKIHFIAADSQNTDIEAFKFNEYVEKT